MLQPYPGRQQFSTQALPAKDRFPVFCEEIVRRAVALDIVRHDDSPFEGEIELCQAGPVDIAIISTSPASYLRTPSLVRDGNDALFAFLCVEGQMMATQGEPRRIAPGDGLLCDSSQTGGLRMETATRYWGVRTSRAHIATLTPRIDRLAGAPLGDHAFALRLLTSYLEGLFSHGAPLGNTTARVFGEHLVDLIAVALGASGEAREQAEAGGVRAARRATILRAIEKESHDPKFSAARLAARLGITPRYVHVLLEETGQTFAEHVLNARLAMVLKRLRDPDARHMKIIEIASEAGFTDLSHFNRSFRRRFGDTPTGVRAMKARLWLEA
ncbi:MULTISPECIES: helix-turn-helix domain-containing protein [Kaistia]|uniref:Helix-turn-helix domain-containing protein n=1 Tax=Kaistia nematophila TaxID=2994654 RepID=A0A9X3ILK1_9HYPH|nr:helix-turn-helix domain-containing protein [Kaistia nematophila]MCX5570754.1 helix-turn-helix domain-containing protein [Kaistia nematophila]